MSDNGKSKVLISGASIAGPALAYWLVRYGYDVTIVERAPGLRKGGYAVDIRGAAIRVVEKMGLIEEVRAADTHIDSLVMVNEDGTQTAQMNDASLGNRRGIDIEIMRDDLTQMLFEQIDGKVEILWGDSITTLTETGAGVHVEFEHAAPRTVDLVAGADGLHSNVRRLTFGDEAQFNRHLGCYISIFTTQNFLDLDHRQITYTVPGRLAGMYSARDSREAKVTMAFRSPELSYARGDIQAQKDILAKVFDDVTGWEVPRLIRAMQESDDLYFDSIAQIVMDRWSKGRVVLLGDAAYCASPASGQGTGLALIGAYVLAGELKAARGDHEKAFAAYETTMREFVNKNQKLGQMSAGGMVEDSKFQIWMRDTMARIPGLMSLIYRFITKTMADVANAVEIKEYGNSVS